jgi:predicted type IV restriction endonuclease
MRVRAERGWLAKKDGRAWVVNQERRPSVGGEPRKKAERGWLTMKDGRAWVVNQERRVVNQETQADKAARAAAWEWATRARALPDPVRYQLTFDGPT